MHRWLIVLSLVVAGSAWSGAQAPRPVVAFVDVTVVPMDRERLIFGRTVIVTDEATAEVGPPSPFECPRARPIDRRGRFLMPGAGALAAPIRQLRSNHPAA